MNKELIINSTAHGVDIALLEDKKLVELHSEKSDARFAVENVTSNAHAIAAARTKSGASACCFTISWLMLASSQICDGRMIPSTLAEASF